jgi:hypothetical protein
MERLAAKGPCLKMHRLSGSPFVRRQGQRGKIASTRRLSERIHQKTLHCLKRRELKSTHDTAPSGVEYLARPKRRSMKARVSS